ncbi:MAG: hypothetical protein WCO89_03680 [Syntrophus sp. (in: bacteria)]
MQDHEEKRKVIARIEQSIDWLCVPKGENRYMLLKHYDRILLLKSMLARIAGMDIKTQTDLIGHWLQTVANDQRKKELAEELLRSMSKVLYVNPHLEKWAEGRLIKMNMAISPRQMSYEYAYLMKQDKRVSGVYMHDMQLIKSRLKKRIVRKGSPVRQKGYEEMHQKPRCKRTIRQNEKYNEKKELIQAEKNRKKEEAEELRKRREAN